MAIIKSKTGSSTGRTRPDAPKTWKPITTNPYKPRSTNLMEEIEEEPSSWVEVAPATPVVEAADVVGGASEALEGFQGMPSGTTTTAGPTPMTTPGAQQGMGSLHDAGAQPRPADPQADPWAGFLAGEQHPGFSTGMWQNQTGQDILSEGIIGANGLPIDRAMVLAHDYQPGADGFVYSAPTPPTNEQEKMLMQRALSSLQQIISSQGIVADHDFMGNEVWYKKGEDGRADKTNPVTNPILTRMLEDAPKMEGFLGDYHTMAEGR